MPVEFLHHVSITAPAAKLAEVHAFYTGVIGLKEGARPDFGFPGHWLYAGTQPIVHLLEGERGATPAGYFDHFALRCSDIDGMRERLQQAGVEFVEFPVADAGQIQIVVTDPADIRVELNFEAATPG